MYNQIGLICYSDLNPLTSIIKASFSNDQKLVQVSMSQSRAQLKYRVQQSRLLTSGLTSLYNLLIYQDKRGTIKSRE